MLHCFGHHFRIIFLLMCEAIYKLMAQFKTATELTKAYIKDVPTFMKEYKLDCPTAYDRLVNGPAHEKKDNPKVVAETVQHFITLMDSLKLNMIAVDQVSPLLADLNDSLNRVGGLPDSFEGKQKVKNWMFVLGKMKASDELSEEQVRQMLFDLEGSYTAFHKSLA
eukprot:TRINITY_DN3216_c0_g1_i1.p1 TRINITY_DN3216_c0_g1~~TRINITY_DN3216_c0_g1_i1.p1  ORF type:complete len:166 (-),score=5.86 TRINITY_DN3216_c0_g1_i1:80-577(-)